jgi:hypothetical protein
MVFHVMVQGRLYRIKGVAHRTNCSWLSKLSLADDNGSLAQQAVFLSGTFLRCLHLLGSQAFLGSLDGVDTYRTPFKRPWLQDFSQTDRESLG